MYKCCGAAAAYVRVTAIRCESSKGNGKTQIRRLIATGEQITLNGGINIHQGARQWIKAAFAVS